jgi:hypothetical protein
MKLFRVETLVAEYSGCRDVRFIWFKSGDDRTRRSYGELIEGYDAMSPAERDEQGIGYAEDYVDELFTEDEAGQLTDYLAREYTGYVTTTREVSLPLQENMMGVGAIAVGGGDGFYTESSKPAYSLPFEVWAYYDLVECQLADGSGIFHERCLVASVDDDGQVSVREETNEEAALHDAPNPRHLN